MLVMEVVEERGIEKLGSVGKEVFVYLKGVGWRRNLLG